MAKTLTASPRQFLSVATLWILLGDEWETALGNYQKLKASMSPERWEKFALSSQENFMAVSCCFDIVDYFFFLPGSVPQPWFYSNRKDWDAPYDRREMQIVLEWARRQVLAYDFPGDKTHALITFFVHDIEMAETLLDKVYLRPALALAALQLGTLSIDIFLNVTGSSDNISKTKHFDESIAHLAREQDERTHPWREWKKVKKSLPLITVHYRNEAVVSSELTATMFLGYYREEDGVIKRREHVFLCRPYLNGLNRNTPFCVRLTQSEKEELVSRDYDNREGFSDLLREFQSASDAPLAEDDDL